MLLLLLLLLFVVGGAGVGVDVGVGDVRSCGRLLPRSASLQIAERGQLTAYTTSKGDVACTHPQNPAFRVAD